MRLSSNNAGVIGDKIMSKIQDNTERIDGYMASMLCAISKTKRGSTVEDDYFVEKLGKLAHIMHYDLVSQTCTALNALDK